VRPCSSLVGCDVNRIVSTSAAAAPVRLPELYNRDSLQRLQAPITESLSLGIGVVLFNNTSAELADFARTLRRAVTCFEEHEAQAAPARATIVNIYVHNNGEIPVDPATIGPDVRFTSASTNLGYARAHNKLMADVFGPETKSDFYLAVHPDGLFHCGTLVELFTIARQCAGRAIVEAAQFPEELPKIFDPLTLDTPWASGCCLLIPAAIYAALGGFDENMFMFCADVDLSWRARLAGFHVKHAPRALFGHRFSRAGNNYALRRKHMDDARYLGAKWSAPRFVSQIERTLAGEGWEPCALPRVVASRASSIADFHHGLSFAPERWKCPIPIPNHAVIPHADVDNTIDVIVRFHDPCQIWRLSRCLFSLYLQSHQPIQALVVLQGFDDAGVAAVNNCIDAFDWSQPRLRPLVTNVRLPPTGDHRARLWNAGLHIGRARYLGFCDFDDVVYSAGYSYLLHRLQSTDAAAVFATTLRVNCTPMHRFDFAFSKESFPGDNRYDFFVDSFCQPNGVLLDRSKIANQDLRANESLAKAEDYLVFATIAAKYDSDWAAIGTAVSDYTQRTDGSNTVLVHRNDAAGRHEWDASLRIVRQRMARLTTRVPVEDIVRMRLAERKLAKLESIMKSSRSLRLTRPLRQIAELARKLERWRRG
jgi:hypothetical protein